MSDHRDEAGQPEGDEERDLREASSEERSEVDALDDTADQGDDAHLHRDASRLAEEG